MTIIINILYEKSLTNNCSVLQAEAAAGNNESFSTAPVTVH